jgi:predicted ATPase
MNDMSKFFPAWIRLLYKEWEGARNIGYTGSIQSEEDFVNLLVRLDINQQLLLKCKINDKEWPVSVFDRYFEQANKLKSKNKPSQTRRKKR